jgi:hypothetical protein
MIRVSLVSALVGFLALSPSTHAADTASLDLGEFSIAADSPTVPKSVSVLNSEKQIVFSVKLDHLIANADGGKLEDSASMTGTFPVQQPQKIQLPSMTVVLSGLIVKGLGSTAKLNIKIGDIEQIVEWKADEAASKAFEITLDQVVPNGELPVPLPLAAYAIVNTDAKAGPVLVSLETIDVKIGPVKVATQQ